MYQLFDFTQNILQARAGILCLERTKSTQYRKEHQSKYLGCVIRWQRDGKKGVDFEAAPVQYIDRVYEIIDGQQRISTIVLILCELYNKIDFLRRDLDDNVPAERELASLLSREIQYNWLLKGFGRQSMTGARYRYRPLLIRQGDELWSHDTVPNYVSPISSYIMSAIVALESARQTGVLNWPISSFPKIRDIVECIRQYLNDVGDDALRVEDHFDETELLEGILAGPSAISIYQYIANNPLKEPYIRKILNHIAFVHFLLNYCAFTVITSPNEETALDMFQSLNATGVQLSAMQILKPRIVRNYREQQVSFSGDIAEHNYEQIMGWFDDARSRNRRTKQFFLNAARIFEGKDAIANLSWQRTWIITAYNNFCSNFGTPPMKIELSRSFIANLRWMKEYLENFALVSRADLIRQTSPTAGGGASFSAMFLKHDSTQQVFALSADASMMLIFLKDVDHELAHSLLARFYISFQQATSNTDIVNSQQNFERMCLGCVAFFILWRITFKQYPDGSYRRLFSNHFSFAQTPGRLNARSVLKQMRREILLELKRQNLCNFSRWDRTFSGNLKYGKERTIIRFVLLLVSHRKTPVANNIEKIGLIESNTHGPDCLRPEYWINEHFQTIEHIAPQATLENNVLYWNQQFLNASDIINSIGNLTLLSSAINPAIPEESAQKLSYYLGLLNQAQPAGVSANTANIMQTAPHLYHLVPVIQRLQSWHEEIDNQQPASMEWNVAFIKEREANLASLARKDLWGWLRC